jgi:hypothetical protein
MPTLDEMSTWTVDEINAQILKLVPASLKFELETHPDHWRASYKTENGVVWSEDHYALRILLLSAYMWLHQRLHPVRVHPAWRPSPSRPLVPVHPSGGSPPVPDPSDLDPAHIASVYAERARKR